MRWLILLAPLFAFASLPYVDSAKFSGKWYEIARTYNKYQKECVASNVEYRLQADKSYRVINRCNKKSFDGELIEYKGKAKAINGKSMERMKMTYFYIFSQEYRVLYRNPNYTQAIVSDKEMKSVWIMSRTPKISKTSSNRLVAKLKPLMDTKRLIYTPQKSHQGASK